MIDWKRVIELVERIKTQELGFVPCPDDHSFARCHPGSRCPTCHAQI